MSPYGKVQFERRVFPRFQLEIPVTYQVLPHGGGAVEGAAGSPASTGNISLGGLQLNLPEAVQVGDRLQIRMFLTDPTGPRRIEATGRVIWVQPAEGAAGPSLVKAGLAFDQIKPEDQVYLKQFEMLWLEQSL